MKMFITVWFVASLSTPGCALNTDVSAVEPLANASDDLDRDAPEATSRTEPQLAPRAVEIGNAFLLGDLGDYENFVAPAGETAVRMLSNGTEVDIHVGDGYWVMSRLFFRGGLFHEDLAVGAHVELGPRNWNVEPDVLQVGVLGCAGPTPGTWTFDAVATHIAIDVYPGPSLDERVLHFVATFQHDDRDQRLGGTFGYVMH
jgi:hypothetical protein